MSDEDSIAFSATAAATTTKILVMRRNGGVRKKRGRQPKYLSCALIAPTRVDLVTFWKYLLSFVDAGRFHCGDRLPKGTYLG